jgi:long-chain acyl-CoA synthetase
MTNLATNLTETASRQPARVALELNGTEVPYAALDAAAARVAGLLAEHGVRPGDRIGLMLPNVPEFAVTYYGTLRAGAIAVPMNTLLKEREASFYLGDSGVCLVFAWYGCADVARAAAAQTGAECVVVAPEEFGQLLASVPPQPEISRREDTDTAIILYTSGTTGTPKGAELTHSNLARNVELVVRLLELSPEDVILGALPLFHAFGQTCGLNAAIATGAKLALIKRFEPREALELIERSRVTVFQGVPTMFTVMLECGPRSDTGSLRVCVSGGAALPVEVMHDFEQTFRCVVLEGYGLSETSPVASFNHRGGAGKPGSIGTPVEGVQMRLVDVAGANAAPGEVGEIAIRGHNVMKGYWNRPDATAEVIRDGWFYTGDLARTDHDGFYFIVDRRRR